MSVLTELREKQQKLVAEARSYLDKANDPKASDADVKEYSERHEKIMDEYDAIGKKIEKQERQEAIEADIEARKERLDREARGSNPNPNAGDEETAADPDAITERQAFEQMMRYGLHDCSREVREMVGSMRENRAQSAGTASEGGYTVPTELYPGVVSRLALIGPMFDANIVDLVQTDAGNTINYPTNDDTANKAVIVAENAAKTSDTDLVFGNVPLGAYMYRAGPIKVSEELLQDSIFDFESIVQAKLDLRFARGANEHMTVGTGSGQPQGVTNAAVGYTAALNNAITFDELFEIEHSIDPVYRKSPSVRYMFNDNTLKAIRKLKDSNGNYIWNPADVRANVPETLNGYAYSVNPDMPNIGSATKPIVFGDFKGLTVRLVRNITMKRLIERYAENGQVGFIGFFRADSRITDTSMLATLQMAV